MEEAPMAYAQIIRSITCLLFLVFTDSATISIALASATVPDILLPDTSHSSERLYSLPGLSNVGRVAPGVLRGAQPGKNGYATLKAMGVKTVIDMRTTANEQKQVEAAGMRAVAFPIVMTRDGLKEKVERVVTLMADPANQPVYVHCRHGQDRTGIVVAAYRMKQQGWSLADAEAEMQAFGFNDVWVNFKQFIRQYGAQLEKPRIGKMGSL
jgi:protein tyrosine/serine phosphatase